MKMNSQGMKVGSVGLMALVAGFVVMQQAAEAALVQYWRFDDGAGTTAANEVGGNTGTLIPGPTPTWTNSGLNPLLTSRTYLPSTYALDFETNSGDYMDGGNLGLVANGSGGQVTVALWAKAESVSSDMRLWGQMSGAGSEGGAVHFLGDGSAEIWNGASWQNIPGSSGALTAGVWKHLAFVWTNNSVQLYVNGTPSGSAISNFDFGVSNGNFGLGGLYLNLYGSRFDGLLDDVAIWNEALSGAQIALLAAGNSPLPPPPAPEPGSLLLLGLGCVVLAKRMRNK